jgi:spermidine synthase
MTKNHRELLVGLVAVGLSGAAALGHQVLWTRRLTDLIGANAESSARVLECFFFGLALGAAIAARVTPTLRRPWLAVGCAELGVALLCVPILLLPTWTSWIWPVLGPERLVGWQGPLARILISVPVIVLPAFLMGTTLPWVAAAVGDSGKGQANFCTWLYAIATLGGASGLALVVGLALHLVGVQGSMLLMIILNLLVACLCLSQEVQPRRAYHPIQDLTAKASVLPEPRLFGLAPVMAFLSGVGMLALEVLGLALLNLKLPLAYYTPAVVLCCFVLLLGCSAAASPPVSRWFGGTGRQLPLVLAAAGAMIAVAPAIFLGLTAGHNTMISHGIGVSHSLFRLACITGLSLGPAVALAGLVFPALLGAKDSTGSGLSGQRLGLLLAINGLGGIIGAETALRLFLPGFGVHVALGMVGGGYAVVAFGLLLVWRSKRLEEWAFVCLLMAATGWLLGGVLPRLPIFLRSSTFQLVEVRSGSEGSLAVVERADLGRAMFWDNLYMLGCSRAVPDLERQAHLPLLLHPAPKRVGFIGLGTGITASGALRHAAVKSVTIVELSKLVASVADRHFRDFNQGVCANPKVKVYVEDAGPFLASAKARFDVIMGDLFTPWRPGEARLCSLEYFASAKAALLPGGVFCQWLPMTQLTEENFETIVATFQQVFGQAHLFRNHFKTGNAPLAIVGLNGPGLDWNIVARRCLEERLNGRLTDPMCRRPQGLAMLYLGTGEARDRWDNRHNTLGNLRVELAAGYHVLAGDPGAYFQGDSDRWLGFLQLQADRTTSSPELPDWLRSFPKAGLLATQWEIAMQRGESSAALLQKQLLVKIPESMLSDTNADWSFWAGHDPRE